jgi:hypothetical protein
MQGGEARRRGRFIAPIADSSALRLILDSFVNHHKMGNLAHNFLPLLEYPLDNKNESSWQLFSRGFQGACKAPWRGAGCPRSSPPSRRRRRRKSEKT